MFSGFRLWAVFSLPPGTFAPYTSVRTSLLVFQREDSDAPDDVPGKDEILYYEVMPPKGQTAFAKRTPIGDEHFAEARCVWHQWKAYLAGDIPRPFPLASDILDGEGHQSADDTRSGEMPHVWAEKTTDIIARGYDLSAHSPYIAKTTKLPPPEEILGLLIRNQREVAKRLEALRRLIDGYDISACAPE